MKIWRNIRFSSITLSVYMRHSFDRSVIENYLSWSYLIHQTSTRKTNWPLMEFHCCLICHRYVVKCHQHSFDIVFPFSTLIFLMTNNHLHYVCVDKETFSAHIHQLQMWTLICRVTTELLQSSIRYSLWLLCRLKFTSAVDVYGWFE